jgi:transposase InsO family protein
MSGEAMRPPRRRRMSWEWRCRIVELILQGSSPQAAAAACGASRATGYRLWQRYCDGGWEALRDRPPIAKTHPRRLSPEAEQQICDLRRQTGWGPRALAAALGRPASTVWRVLRRHGISRRQTQPRPAANRYEHPRVGDLLHIDTKKLGRFWRVGKRITGRGPSHPRSSRAGWQHLHVAIDDHSRLAQAEIRPTDDAADCVAALRRAVSVYAGHGITIRRVLTDNGSGYRSRAWRAACRELGIRHLRTRPYTPRTNGKAEAFIRILLREWAYAYIYPTSSHRSRALLGWLRWYNKHRPHGSLQGHPPISRVSQAPVLNS